MAFQGLVYCPRIDNNVSLDSQDSVLFTKNFFRDLFVMCQKVFPEFFQEHYLRVQALNPLELVALNFCFSLRSLWILMDGQTLSVNGMLMCTWDWNFNWDTEFQMCLTIKLCLTETSAERFARWKADKEKRRQQLLSQQMQLEAMKSEAKNKTTGIPWYSGLWTTAP